MWIISSIAEHWNALGSSDVYTEKTAQHVMPLVQKCNFLIQSGLDEDTTRPSGAEEELLPMLMQRKKLIAMRNAGIAVAWQNMADNLKINENEELAAHYHTKGKMLLESAKAATSADPFLKKAFVKAREIEAGGAFAEQWKEQSEQTPMEKYSIRAQALFSAVASEIGFGLMHNARYTKKEALRGSEVCAGDLVEVHQVKPEDLSKKLLKKSLKALLGEELQSSTGALQELPWMKEDSSSAFKGQSEIRLS